MTDTRSQSPPSGRQIELRAGDYRAVVVEVGGALRTLHHGDAAILDGYHEQEICDGARGQLLIPWPNRVAGGRYTFDGADRQLDITEPERACAIHGLVRWEAWTILQAGPDQAALAHRLHPHPGYPHTIDLRVDYRLDRDTGLQIALTATNIGARTAPYGLGMHPYLRLSRPRIDDLHLTIPGASYRPIDTGSIPTGAVESVTGTELDFRAPRAIGSTKIDFAFSDLTRDPDGRARVILRDPDTGDGVCLWVDDRFPHLQIFTGDHLPARIREGLGVEPMTCPPNALVTGEDLISLSPGHSHTATWGIQALAPA